MDDQNAIITIRTGTPADADALAPFAQRVFRRTFESDPAHHPDDMNLHLAQTMSADALRMEIADPRVWYFLATIDGVLCGYLKLEASDAPGCVRGPRPIELARLYIDPSQHGRGLAQRFMRHGIDFGQQRGYETMWLGVWHRNHRARRFYEKCGFSHCGEHPFLFGTDMQSDLVYERSIRRAEAGHAPPA